MRRTTSDGGGSADRTTDERGRLYQHSNQSSQTLKGVLADILPQAEFLGGDTRADEREETQADHRFVLRLSLENGQKRTFCVYTPDAGGVWIDVSRLMGTMDTFICEATDKFVDLKRVPDAIKAAGIALREKFDAYRIEILNSGRSATGTQGFKEHELTPLLNEMRVKQMGAGKT
ncbi:MAG: hypothetical protein LBU43_09335 [Candidatus Accumulibacter sp.]|nr:hypothetical protein [Accumulibacter sp.]